MHFYYYLYWLNLWTSIRFCPLYLRDKLLFEGIIYFVLLYAYGSIKNRQSSINLHSPQLSQKYWFYITAKSSSLSHFPPTSESCTQTPQRHHFIFPLFSAVWFSYFSPLSPTETRNRHTPPPPISALKYFFSSLTSGDEWGRLILEHANPPPAGLICPRRYDCCAATGATAASSSCLPITRVLCGSTKLPAISLTNLWKMRSAHRSLRAAGAQRHC